MATRYLTKEEILAIQPSEFKRYMVAVNDGQGDTNLHSFETIVDHVKSYWSDFADDLKKFPNDPVLLESPTYQRYQGEVEIVDILEYIWEIQFNNANMTDFGYIKDDLSLEKVWLSLGD